LTAKKCVGCILKGCEPGHVPPLAMPLVPTSILREATKFQWVFQNNGVA